MVVTFSTMTYIIYRHAALNKQFCTRLSGGKHRNGCSISIHHGRLPISRKSISDQRALPLVPKAAGKVTLSKLGRKHVSHVRLLEKFTVSATGYFLGHIGRTLRNPRFCLALKETLPVDSEKPERDNIVTSGNESAAPNHY